MSYERTKEKGRFIIKKITVIVVEIGGWFGLSSGAAKVGGLKNVTGMRVCYGRWRCRR